MSEQAEELIEAFLASGDDDAAHRYGKLLATQRQPAAALAIGRSLLDAPDARKRALGAAVLYHLGPDSPMLGPSLVTAIEALRTETDADVLSILIDVLGSAGDEEALEQVLFLRTHPDDRVRWHVAAQLPFLTDPEEPDRRVIDVLVELSRDLDEDTRDVATFGLGSQLLIDSSDIRSALLARVNDLNKDTRSEALFGLAQRADMRVIGPLLSELSSQTVGRLDVRAAAEVADPRLCEALVRLRTWWDVDEELLTTAIARCCRASNVHLRQDSGGQAPRGSRSFWRAPRSRR